MSAFTELIPRSAGELLVAVAEMMAVSGDHLAYLDELREVEAGTELRAVGEAWRRPEVTVEPVVGRVPGAPMAWPAVRPETR
jgi:hypothetical protein